MIRIYINRQHIAENRDKLKKGNPPMPPIMIDDNGDISHCFGCEFNGFRIVYFPECLHANPDNGAPDLWVELDTTISELSLQHEFKPSR